MYTPSEVASALRDEPSDRILAIDLALALRTLPSTDLALLRAYAAGYSPVEAARRAGLTENLQRAYEDALRRLVGILNQGE